MKDPAFAKFVLLVNGLVPIVLLAFDWHQNQLGPDKLSTAIHVTGMTALIFIMLTLCVTPVRKLTGWNFLSHFRRSLGLFAFFYASAHLFLFVYYSEQIDLARLVRDTLNSKFILYGMIAWALMAPLAATSTNGMIKRLGAARWKALHKLVYATALLAMFHYWMQGKVVRPMQIAFAIATAILLGYRAIPVFLPARNKVALPSRVAATTNPPTDPNAHKPL